MTMQHVLALHGFMQNAAVLRSRTGALRKGLADLIELEFATAPTPATELPDYAPATAPPNLDGSLRGWWLYNVPALCENPDPNPPLGLVTSLALLLDQLATAEAPLVGLFAFSQGAGMAATLLVFLQALDARPSGVSAADAARSLAAQAVHRLKDGSVESGAKDALDRVAAAASALVERTGNAPFGGLKYAVLVSGFRPHFVFFNDWLTASGSSELQLSSLQVYGLADDWVVPERSRVLGDMFSSKGRHLLEHPGRHVIPTDSAARQQFAEFFRLFV